MEYAGPSLHDALHGAPGGRPFPEADMRRIIRQILGGARHMHRRRIIHRDIKAENVLVGGGRGDGANVKICDVGLAVPMSEAPPPYGRCGTRQYLAPKVLLGKTHYDAMVDMWSLGCVMVQLLVGKPLCDGDDDADQLLRIFKAR